MTDPPHTCDTCELSVLGNPPCLKCKGSGMDPEHKDRDGNPKYCDHCRGSGV